MLNGKQSTAGNIPRILISADRSSSGKTTISMGLMAALVSRGYKVQPFKVALDYIDPSYHTEITGRFCRNLDGYLMDENGILDVYTHACEAGEKADIAIIEGDEYFASPLDKRPKFLHYQSQITLISGIAWDHFNVFPTFNNYTDQFKQLMEGTKSSDTLIVFNDDTNIQSLINESKIAATIISYQTPEYVLNNHKFQINTTTNQYTFSIFGRHNMQNMEGAKKVCNALGISDADFYTAMQSFKGAAKRLEILKQNNDHIIFRDFAHAPSKVEATVNAVKEQYPEKNLVACLELHTYSSLNKDFINQYYNTMQKADVRIVYFNPHTLTLKKLPHLSTAEVQHYFNDTDMHVVNDSAQLLLLLQKLNIVNTNLLLMSSGNFDNLDLTILT